MRVRDRSFDVAVTGVGARFPGCADLGEWWQAVLAGRILTRRYDRTNLLGAGVPAEIADDPDYVPVRGHLADAERFDNDLFRMNPRDAEMMDPQHRLMLEVAWTALEDAASGFGAPVPTTAVFASGSGSGYLRTMLSRGPLDAVTLDRALHGTEPDFIASLLSYKLDLTGPAIAVQTACSSGLVGVHLAVQSLMAGDCDQAVVVAGGVDWPQVGQLHVPGGISSPSGRCRPFDAAADGVIAGSGAVAVVIRRLEDADAVGAEPHGVILGTAVNNDGAAKVGYYAPSIEGQQSVITAACRSADVSGDSIGYLETHGTGTPLGDPIEWAAASDALIGLGAAPGQVEIGALKANIGHLDAAAGLAGLVKALFVVREGVVPPVAGFAALNPLLDGATPFTVPTEARAWRGPEPRRAGVSSFGIGGTNAHVVVEAPPPRAAEPLAPPAATLVVLSAATPDALARRSAQLADHLGGGSVALADVAYTLAVGRARLSERLAVAGRTPVEVAERLRTDRDLAQGVAGNAGPAPLLLLFPGQGSQRPGMARAATAALPGFAAALELSVNAFASDLRPQLWAVLLEDTHPEEELRATGLAQPALFAFEYALAVALAAGGLEPAAVVGHSLGEITAACVAGILDLEAAAHLVTVRARAMQACPEGSMLAVACDEATARRHVDERPGLAVAAVNGPGLCVVAGPTEAIVRLGDELDGEVWCRPLRTSHAFHSGLMVGAVPEVRAALAGTTLRPPQLHFGANATGRLVAADDEVGPELFVDQICHPVRFGAALAAVAARVPGAVAVEVGPGTALSSLAAAAGLTCVPLVPGRGDDELALLTALGQLWAQGQPVDLEALGGGRRLVHLPTYPFAGRRWIAPEVLRGLDAPQLAPDAAAQDLPADEWLGDPAVTVAALWVDLLGHDGLGDDADFFDLGGDSMLVTHLARRLKELLGVQVSLREMLSARTLGRQQQLVAARVADHQQ